MRPIVHTLVACVALLGVGLACKASGGSSTSSASASSSASAAPMKPWIEQARAMWPDAKIEDNESDATRHLVRIMVSTKQAPKPAELAEHLQKALAIDAPDRPCAINLSGSSPTLDGGTEAFFVGHIVIEDGVAYSAMKPHDVAKRLVERNDKFQCEAPTWLMVSSHGHFERDWRAYVREYSNVWDGSEKNVLEQEKMCERAADLELLSGETFPDSSDAIENGVKFPKSSSQTIKWRSFAEFKDSKDWFDCEIHANEAPKITWDHPRD